MGKPIEIDNIERLEMMEEKFGISIEGVFAEFNNEHSTLEVKGEIQATNGTTIDDDIDLQVTAYNSSGKVILSTSRSFYAEDFFGVDSFSTYDDIIEKPTKIRIYPKKG